MHSSIRRTKNSRLVTQLLQHLQCIASKINANLKAHVASHFTQYYFLDLQSIVNILQ